MKILLIFALFFVACNTKPTIVTVTVHDTCYLSKVIYKDTCRVVKIKHTQTVNIGPTTINQTGGQTATEINNYTK